MALPTDSKNLVTVERLSAVIGGTDGTGGLWGKTKGLITALDGAITGTAGAGKTLTAFSQTDGKVSATFGNISITKSQISDFPTIPTVNNGTLTIKQNGTSAGTFTANQSGNSTIELTDTTYESKAAASGGTDVSLVTTGEKYTWNNKSNLALGETNTTAYRGDRGKTAYDHSQSTHAPTTSASEASGGTTLSLVTTGEKYTWNHKANTASPAFSGTPTAPTANAGTNTTQIATTAFVKAEIDSVLDAADAMQFKGTIGSSGATVTELPATHKAGWTYKVSTAGTYAGKTCEVGDMIICVKDGTTAADADWTVVQNNIDGAVTGPASSVDARVAVFNGTTGKVIKDSGFTIGKSVPSNAVFTDTDTKVTSADNHYAPSTVSGQDKSASASGATAAWSIDVVKGITLNTDGKGHVTGISVTSGKIPANPNTDTKVKATVKTDDVNYKILATASASPTSGNATEAVYGANITLNPSTNTIAASISGNAATATSATTASNYATGGTIESALSGKAASSHAHGNVTSGGAITADAVTIASGDALTIVDSSASGKLVKSSVTFDGSTTTQALTKAGTWATFNNYSHPTTSGNKHIPSGGSSGQFLGWSADGTAAWVANPNTDTSVTAVGNHYAPAEDSTAEKDASGGAATQLPTSSSGTLVQVVTGVKMDAKGHVTGVVSKGLWSPDNNTTYTPQKLGFGYGTCGTAESTAAKAVTLSGYEIVTNGIVAVKFTYAVPASATLNINSKGAKNIYYRGAAITAGVIGAGDIATFIYDGTQYQLLSVDSGEQEMTDTEVTDLLDALT